MAVNFFFCYKNDKKNNNCYIILHRKMYLLERSYLKWIQTCANFNYCFSKIMKHLASQRSAYFNEMGTIPFFDAKKSFKKETVVRNVPFLLSDSDVKKTNVLLFFCNFRISRSSLNLVGDGGIPKFARVFRRWR